MKRINLRPYHGIILFIVHTIIFITVSANLQYNLGMFGLFLTEVIILLFAAMPVILSGNSLREVLPVKKITLRQIFAIMIFWIASFIVNILFGLVTALIAPRQLVEISQAMFGMFNSVPFILSFLIVAVMPAICEEAMHRGFIQYTMRNVKRKWQIVLIMGIIFGIFHLDPLRFMGTAMLGAILSYMMLETKNFLVPVLLHLFNNAISVTVSAFSGTNQELMGENAFSPMVESAFSPIGIWSSLGVYLMLSAAVPFLFIAGSRLLHSRAENMEKRLSMEKGCSVEKGLSMEKGRSVEKGSSMEKGCSVEKGSSMEKGRSVEKGFSMEKGRSVEKGLYMEKGPFLEDKDIMKRKHSGVKIYVFAAVISSVLFLGGLGAFCISVVSLLSRGPLY